MKEVYNVKEDIEILMTCAYQFLSSGTQSAQLRKENVIGVTSKKTTS